MCLKDVTFHKHGTIPVQHFEALKSKLIAIDNALSLYLTNHHSSPLLVKLLDSASTLANQRIKILDIECILYFNLEIYKVYKLGGGLFDYSQIYIKFPSGFTNIKLHQRRADFTTAVNKWIDENKMAHSLPATEILLLLSDRTPSPSKVVKPTSPSKRVFGDLKNNASKFQFKERIELIQKQKNQGLSLVERIKLKEQLAATQKQDPKKDYQDYLLGKAKVVYEIIYQSVSKDSSVKSFSMAKLCEIVKDSLSYPSTSEEIVDVVKLISQKLDRDSFSLIERNGITVLRVGGLDRTKDLSTIRSI